MIKLERLQNYIFILILSFGVLLLLSIIPDLSISYKESIIYFDKKDFLHYITVISTYIFGQNDFGLRLPFVAFYIGSAIVFYKLFEDFYKKKIDNLYSISLFLFLPGVFASAVLVNNAIIIIFFTFLYLYIYKIKKRHNYILLSFLLFIDNSFAILYLSFAINSVLNKDNKEASIFSLLFFLSLMIYGFETYGKPKSYFIDTFGIYSSIFSPIIFFYYCYSIYRASIKYERNIYLGIAATALAFSLLLSFRQKILIEDFAPYLIVGMPIMLKTYLNSYRVRLKQFRHRHNYLTTLAIVFLSFTIISMIFNKSLYLLLDRPKDNFIYKYHFAKEIAQSLKDKNISSAIFSDYRLERRLKFYGIDEGEKYYITNYKLDNNSTILPIIYNNKTILTLYLNEKQ